MNQPLLSILIPTTLGRIKDTERLVNNILLQHHLPIGFAYDLPPFDWSGCESDEVEVLVCSDDKTATIGEKREIMYKHSKGGYSWQIDDDDDIAPNAIQLILEAIKSNQNVDCITFEERCDMNGKIKRSNHALKYDKWQDSFDGFDYVRCPFYKDVIRTDIAKSVPFPHIRYNEDEQWSMALRPHLKTEVHIDEQLYLYSYYPKETHEERYGLNRQ